MEGVEFGPRHPAKHIYIYIYVYIYIYMCVYVFIYIYIYIWSMGVNPPGSMWSIHFIVLHSSAVWREQLVFFQEALQVDG